MSIEDDPRVELPALDRVDDPVIKRKVSTTERLTAALAAAVLIAVAILATPYCDVKLLQVPGFLVAYSTGLFILDILVFVLLISKARIEGNRGHMLLATAYLYAGIIIIPHLLTFPNALVPGMVLGVAGSAIWLWTFWHAGFAGLVIAYALLTKPMPSTGAPRVLATVLTALTLTGVAAYVAIDRVQDLPPILQGDRYFSGVAGHAVMAAVFGLTLGACALVLFKFRLRNAEDLWLTVGLVGACADVWLTLDAGARYSLGWYCGRICGISTVFVLFTSLLNDVLMTYKSVTVANDVLDRLTLTDSLTNLGNRRLFDDILSKEWRRCRRENAQLTIIMIDVDDFKSYNDTYGHQAGDWCLQKIAEELHASAARPGDVAIRYGGEEFALILPATDSAGGEYLARRIRLRIRDLAIPHALSARKVITVSAGIASLVPSDSFEEDELVRLADVALYRAKAAGRDTVIVAG
jgi:diguanylate cyclase (GGDEF)-like protein